MHRFPIRLIAHLLIFILLLSGIVPGAPVHAQGTDEYVAGEVVVKLAQAGDLAGVTAAYELDPTPIDQFGTRAIYRLRILDQSTPPDKAAALAADGRVLYAEPNFLQQTPEGQQRTSWAAGGGAGEYAVQWAAGQIRLSQAHTVTRGAGTVIAVLDTGVDPTHPQLAGRLGSGYDFVNMDADPREEGAYGVNIAYGHGTHVAGLVALAAPEAKIMPVRVLDPEGVGNIWVLAEALAYAANPDGNPGTDDGADVINLSLSTPRRTALLNEIMKDITCSNGADGDDDDGDDDDGDDDDGDDDDGDDDDGDDDDGDDGDDDDGDDDDGDDDDGDDAPCLAVRQKGIVVVAAAGNRGSSTPEYPAGEEVAGLIAVAASTSSDTLAPFSNYGAWVTVAAPGDQVMSSVPGGGYGVWSGTSMATPLTAGVAALIRATDQKLTPPAVAELIRTTAVSIGGPVPKRLNAAAAVALTAASANHAIFLAVVSSPNTPGSSADETCNGSLGQVTVDHLRVPDNATCILTGTRLIGTLKVANNATLWASGVHVNGSIQAENAAAVTVTANSFVGGSIQIKQGSAASIELTRINGDLQFDANDSMLTATGNTIGGNLHTFQNTGGVTLQQNTVDGNLQCKENNPAPTGGGNIVKGSKEDQCSRL